MGRNPQTGEPIKIPAKRVVRIRAAKVLKDAVLGEEVAPGTCRGRRGGRSRRRPGRHHPSWSPASGRAWSTSPVRAGLLRSGSCFTSRARSRPIWTTRRDRVGGAGRRPARRRRALRAARRPRLHPRARRRGSASPAPSRSRWPPSSSRPSSTRPAPSRSTPSSPDPRGSTACGCASASCPCPRPSCRRRCAGGPGRAPRLAPARYLRGPRPGPRGRGPAARAAVIVALAGGTGAAKLLRGLVRVTEPAASSSSATPATISTGGGSTSRPTSTPWPMPSRVSSTARGAGGSATRPFTAWRRWASSGARPGSASATATWRPTCTAPCSSARAPRSATPPARSPTPSA